MWHETWSNMTTLDLPVLEKILRPIVIYLFLVVGLRVAGKRQLAQLNPLDLTVLLTLSNTVQNAIIGNDNSVVGGIIGAITLLAINRSANALMYRRDAIERLIEGTPRLLIEDGNVNKRAIRAEEISEADLMQAIHRAGVNDLPGVHRAYLEPAGTISVIPAMTPETQAIMERLDRIEALLTGARASQGTQAPGSGEG